jgi:hypothetical protein
LLARFASVDLDAMWTPRRKRDRERHQFLALSRDYSGSHGCLVDSLAKGFESLWRVGLNAFHLVKILLVVHDESSSNNVGIVLGASGVVFCCRLGCVPLEISETVTKRRQRRKK